MSDQFILTSTGLLFWPLDPRPEDVCLQDIAHALSMKCRFTGHTRSFFSVAAHSLFVCDMVRCGMKASSEGPEKESYNQLCMYGLLHDAAEAYLPDIARPIKSEIPGFAAIEHNVMMAIYDGLGLAWPSTGIMSYAKAADNEALLHEMRALLPQHPKCNELAEAYNGISPPGLKYLMDMCQSNNPFGSVCDLFLRTFMELNQNEGVLTAQ